MADIITITKARAEEILAGSVVSGSINGSGHLILTRANGQTIDGGDFTAIVTSIFESTVVQEVTDQLFEKLPGKFVAKGNISGAVTFGEYTNVNLPNSMITATLTGNISINTTALPSSCKAGTQFAMRLTQDATGGRTLTLTGFKKSQGVLTLTTAPNAIDIVVFLYDGTNWYAGMMGDDFK